MRVWHVLFACIGAVCLTSSRGRQLHGSGLVLQGLLLPWTHHFSQGVEDRYGPPIAQTLPCVRSRSNAPSILTICVTSPANGRRVRCSTTSMAARMARSRCVTTAGVGTKFCSGRATPSTSRSRICACPSSAANTRCRFCWRPSASAACSTRRASRPWRRRPGRRALGFVCRASPAMPAKPSRPAPKRRCGISSISRAGAR